MQQLQKMLIDKRTYPDIPLFWLHSSKGTPNFVRQKVTNLTILNFNFLSNAIGYINPSMRQSSSSTIFDDTLLRLVIRTYTHIRTYTIKGRQIWPTVRNKLRSKKPNNKVHQYIKLYAMRRSSRNHTS